MLNKKRYTAKSYVALMGLKKIYKKTKPKKLENRNLIVRPSKIPQAAILLASLKRQASGNDFSMAKSFVCYKQASSDV